MSGCYPKAEKARIHGTSLEPLRRARLARLRPAANAAGLRVETAASDLDRDARRAGWTTLLARANDLEYGTFTRGAIIAAWIGRRVGGLEAFVASEAAHLEATWPYVTQLELARREVIQARRRWLLGGRSPEDEAATAAAEAEVARLEQSRAATCEAQARGLIAQALAGEVQATFRVLPIELARDLVGPVGLACAYLADAEDYPDEY